MSEDSSQAISFANSYFALADGLVSDFENYLADDVILDWFGQTIKGRKNVSAFMKYRNINSRHIIDEINSTSSIEYRKHRPLRRKYYSIGNSCGNKTIDIDNEENGIRYKRKCYSEGVVDGNNLSADNSASETIVGMDIETDYADFKIASTELQDDNSNRNYLTDASICDLNFDKLKLDSYVSTSKKTRVLKFDENDNDNDNNNYDDLNLCDDNSKEVTNEFLKKLEMRPTSFDEIEKKIIYLREKNESAGRIESGQGDGPVSVDKKMNPIKYVAACGVIKSARFFTAKQIRKDLRQRQCRLQIAYSNKEINSKLSTKTESTQTVKGTGGNDTETSAMELDGINSNSSKLLSLQDIRKLSNKLVSRDENANDPDNAEGCYCDDRNKFLRCMELEIIDNVKVNENDFVTPKYKRHQLTFDKSPKRLFNGIETGRGFVFNYTIHLIIYESNTKCRLNLSNEFDC